MRESLPDFTEEAVEIPDEPRPEPPKPPPPPPERAPRRAATRSRTDRPSRVDFDAIAASHPPSMVLRAEDLYRRPMWASRASWLRTPAGQLIQDGVPPYFAYAASALFGAALALSVYLGLM